MAASSSNPSRAFRRSHDHRMLGCATNQRSQNIGCPQTSWTELEKIPYEPPSGASDLILNLTRSESDPMARKLLDTSVLIRYWRHRSGDSLKAKTIQDPGSWGKSLTELQGTDAIVTPVYLEFVAGVMSAHELKLAQEYLGQFKVVDGGNISASDWNEARRIAQ